MRDSSMAFSQVVEFAGYDGEIARFRLAKAVGQISVTRRFANRWFAYRLADIRALPHRGRLVKSIILIVFLFPASQGKGNGRNAKNNQDSFEHSPCPVLPHRIWIDLFARRHAPRSNSKCCNFAVCVFNVKNIYFFFIKNAMVILEFS
ncbi:MAG: hypothetical protein Q9P14_14625 [candidate division KSB1 bacterium]|nr:hypothetical protein [candidate division KSB1 bacterium]